MMALGRLRRSAGASPIRYGGTVRAESAGEGTGATFVVRLPLSLGEVRSGSRLETAPPPRELLRGRRVLVVDDDPDARDLLVAVLSIAGAEVTASDSVADCLAAFERPHVVVADIAMPGEDGYALLSRLRSRPSEGGRAVPVVAVTARSRREDRARALAAGFDMHFVKPIDPAELATAVATLADRAG